MTIEEYAKIATSANEQPDQSKTIGRYFDEKLGWMTLYKKHDGEVRYVTDQMRRFNEYMKQAQRQQREKRRSQK